MNILQVVGICGGGLGRHVRYLSQGIISQGHKLTVAYAPHRIDQAFEQFVVDRQKEIRFVPLVVSREISPVSDLRAVIQLLRLMRSEGQFDIVHGHSAKGGAIARVASRWAGVPCVYTPNGLLMSSPNIPNTEAGIYTSIERILGHWATSRIIAVSKGEGEFIVKHKLVPEDRIVLIENSLDDKDFEDFSKATSGKDLKDTNQKPLTFGSAIRFSAQKAPDHLVEAFIRLSNTLPQVPVRLVIAGDGELFGQTKRQIEASGLDNKISLLGWRTDIKDVLRELDIFVLPSLYEGLPYAVLEAMAAKLPIIATDVFGVEETVSSVPGNIVVPAGATAALADGMKRMATLGERQSVRRLLQKIGQANYDYARRHFEQSKNTHYHLQVYEECIHEKICS